MVARDAGQMGLVRRTATARARPIPRHRTEDGPPSVTGASEPFCVVTAPRLRGADRPPSG